MRPFGEGYEASLKIDDETQQRVAETYEVETDLKKAEKLQSELKRLGTEITIEEALDKIMQWKITREANTTMSLAALAEQIFKSKKVPQ